ncbi:hypothetical protein AX16_005825 [Volvariella volvacea WC 439]|nr:hypothetical protein AX16_005825 [Volvariella volvacea WC 439]
MVFSWLHTFIWYAVSYLWQVIYNIFSPPKPDLVQTRDTIVSFLKRCNLPFPVVPYDKEFEEQCNEFCRRRGYPLKGKHGIGGPFMVCGVVMARSAYGHLPNIDNQIYVSVYTAFLVYLDDVFNKDITLVRDFNEKFIANKPQANKTLDGFAHMLREDTPRLFHKVVSNIIITSTLNLVTALLLENETQGMKLQHSAVGYPTFSRVMSGASEAYALFSFPKELPLQSFIQALPEMMIYINNGNDILSFYKEDSDGETVNRPSWLAECHQVSKNKALKMLEDAAVEAHTRILQTLKPHQGAYEAYSAFSKGYIGFHSGLQRYRLHELNLGEKGNA